MEPKKTILIAEDDKFLIDLYSRAFGQKGFEVIAAADGEEAVEKAKIKPPAIILLDIMMPKMDGLTALRELKSGNGELKNVPVYMLTNLGQESVIKESLKIGATGYLLKSKYLPNQIVEEIENYLSTQNQ